MTPLTTIIKRYNNGGTIEKYTCFEYKGADYSRVYACCKHFAKQGKRTIIMPRVHYKDQAYKVIYGSLIGTKYEKKCPDIRVDGVFYEHEGFTSNSSKNAFRNMISNGVKQSNRIIIDACGMARRRALKNIHRRIAQGAQIREVWILEQDMTLTRLF